MDNITFFYRLFLEDKVKLGSAEGYRCLFWPPQYKNYDFLFNVNSDIAGVKMLDRYGVF